MQAADSTTAKDAFLQKRHPNHGALGQFDLPYGNSTTGERQTANFSAEGSTTLTWQVYLPGCNFSSGTLNVTGTAFDFAFSPSEIVSAVSNALALPR